jgi:hypothetical protein
MNEAPLNKMARRSDGRHTTEPRTRSRGVIEVYPAEDAAEYMAKCKCGSIVNVPRGGAVDCPCGRLLRWKTSLSPAREMTIGAQEV